MQPTSLQNELYTYFGKHSFLPGQQAIIEDVLAGRDVLGILPTGSGKSLCYQLPAKLLSGVTIIVSPLISLMSDQVKQLKANQFSDVIALNSFLDLYERKKEYPNLNKYKLIYVSPELLQQEEVLYWLGKLAISLFVVDEAHCISQWGHEFRPDYLRLDNVIRNLGNPVVLALSATATEEVREDIIHSLDRPSMKEHVHPIDRSNIIYDVHHVKDNNEKVCYIAKLMRTYQIPIIIYFSSRQTCEEIAEILSRDVPERQTAYYHGGMEQIDRTLVQQQFMNDQIDVICATSAFGMGINKQNTRMVVHYHLPAQIESFIQETGRAGRDGRPSVSLLLYSESDKYIPKSFIKNELPTMDDVIFVWNRLYELYIKGRPIPSDEEKIKSYFHLSQTQWRFLFYQMSNHDMIYGRNIIYNKQHWRETLDEIEQVIRERVNQKENKVAEMVNWISEKNCLRKTLFQGFQSSYTPPEKDCCTNCGFKLFDWDPAMTEKRSPGKPWEQTLKNIFIEIG
ncbi:MAG TPA: ATP-dependent DNA helicase RecQ [Virgibacillus sp.]|nr:ATP-dependent DNA helicase RecQ [Virgibacillus sp.]